MPDDKKPRRVPLSQAAASNPDSFVDGPFGSNLKSTEYTETGVRLIQLQNIGDGYWIDDNKKFVTHAKFEALRRHGAHPGDIAIAKMAHPVARACLIPNVCSQLLVVADCIRLAVDQRTFDPQFVVYAINSRDTRLEAENKSIGTTRQRINLSVLKTVSIFAPPAPEQRRIAEILDTADAAIRKTEQLIAKLKQVKQALLHDLLTRGIDDNGELRDPVRHPEDFKDTALGRIPKSWEVQACSDVCREIVVGIVVKPAQYYKGTGVPILRSANVREEGVTLEDLKYMSPEQHRILSKSSVTPGDVVTVRTGYPGTTAVIPPTLPTANCIDIIVSRPTSQISARFLALWVNSDHGKGQVLRRQGGLAQQHFNVGEMKELVVARPSVPEQNRIASIFEALTKRVESERMAAAKLRLLKQGLMEDLLTGRVRVTRLLDEAAA